MAGGKKEKKAKKQDEGSSEEQKKTKVVPKKKIQTWRDKQRKKKEFDKLLQTQSTVRSQEVE